MTESEQVVERPIELEGWPGGPRTPGVLAMAIPDAGQRLRSAAVALGLGVLLAS